MRVAVMQPYFYPYMGYFHLIAAVDLFILFDCVQFPRRGRVHRCDMPDGKWLTLPLARAPQSVRIGALHFAPAAGARMEAALSAYPWVSALPQHVRSVLSGPWDSPVDYLHRNLQTVSAYLGVSTPIRRSSEFAISPEIRKGDRVRAVARAAGASHYLNASGGRTLYDPAEFAADGLTLEFLAPYTGPHRHMLHALATVPPDELRADAARWTRDPA